MKPQSKTTVFSDCTCPYCEEAIHYDAIHFFFCAMDYVTEFEYPCPHCGKLIMVEVEQTPSFKFNKEVVEIAKSGILNPGQAIEKIGRLKPFEFNENSLTDAREFWTCPECSHENHWMAIKCFFCDHAAPESK